MQEIKRGILTHAPKFNKKVRLYIKVEEENEKVFETDLDINKKLVNKEVYYVVDDNNKIVCIDSDADNVVSYVLPLKPLQKARNQAIKFSFYIIEVGVLFLFLSFLAHNYFDSWDISKRITLNQYMYALAIYEIIFTVMAVIYYFVVALLLRNMYIKSKNKKIIKKRKEITMDVVRNKI